ncbi:MAG TPA: ATPase [Bacteroidetes bacterium]|nr:ATPase [Bacteroidota bacterium]
MSQNHNYIYYGTRCSSKEVEAFVRHAIEVNTLAETEGRPKTPICIWGQRGIGKTQLVEQIAANVGCKWAYIAPAQFEEMGDLLGMPQVVEGADGQNATHFVAPEWVPREEGPGILLIDDVNRADDRILRGIMQLLQNYELVSWKLPKGWHIVLTANPDGGDYSVTPMDFAMLTRMMHITMIFEVKRWAWWAEKSQVDPRGINFVLTYPETVTGERTTPRTLVQFFESIQSIDDLKENQGLVKMLGDSCLDPATVTSFLSFINNQLSKLISPAEILDAADFKVEVYDVVKAQVVGETKRVDIISVLCTRLFNHLSVNNPQLTDGQTNNLADFLMMDFLPNDIRLNTLRDLANCNNDSVKKIVRRPDLGQMLLNATGQWTASN